MGIASNNDMVRWEDDVRQAGNSGILFEQPPWADDSFYTDDDDEYEDEDDGPGTESFEGNSHDDTDDSEDDESDQGAVPRLKMDPALTRWKATHSIDFARVVFINIPSPLLLYLVLHSPPVDLPFLLHFC